MVLQLKNYQSDCLGKLDEYLMLARELGDADTAFYKQTHRLYHKIEGLEALPYVCLRVPTGGGKTLMACHAIPILLETWQQRESGLVLWLAPTTKIVDQTMDALKDRKHPYRQALDAQYGQVNILDMESALYLRKHTLDTGLTIIVTTTQSLRIEDMEKRKVFDVNGELKHHFDAWSEEQKQAVARIQAIGDDPTLPTLQNVIRLRCPAVIVDEAHGFRTKLSFDTLRRFNPASILELTATPHDNSNVLHSVSAAELKAEEMIKLPVMLRTRKMDLDVIAQAVKKQQELEAISNEQQKSGGEYVRPVVLYQAHKKNSGDLVPEELKKVLIEQHDIPEDHIAICVGKVDELPDLSMLSMDNPVRHVITVQRLREGWDCPFAYILCSVGNLTSSTAVEQLIGRVLRMPYATRQQHDELNVAYAYSVSDSFEQAANSLVDNIVKSGFSKFEAQKVVVKNPDPTDEELPLFDTQHEEFSVEIESAPNVQSLPKAIAQNTKVESTAQGVKLTWTAGPMTDAAAKALSGVFAGHKDQEQVQVLKLKSRNQDHSPAAMGKILRVPGLAIKDDSGQLEIFDGQHEEADWDLVSCNHEVVESEFKISNEQGKVAKVDADKQAGITVNIQSDMDQLIFAFDMEGPKTPSELAIWLSHKISEQHIVHKDKALFLRKMVDYLIAKRGYPIEQLARHRHRLKDAAAAKISAHRINAEVNAYQNLMDFATVDQDCFVEFPAFYPVNELYQGKFEFNKHFYRDIGEMNKEEILVAQYIDSLPEVEYWVRNLDRKSGFYSLPMPHGNFWPDFVVQLVGEYTMVIEHKGEHLEEAQKQQDKKKIGELWEAKDDTKSTAFAWTTKDDYKQVIDAALIRLGFKCD
ncbi:MAG TPA: hypothetical protein DCM28_21255 [Phycisphaerales bacterium]|nr:hypothetical protein [Phycisphaerales bacterium]HCD31384.1 hypothetical protein [Phycisphaerales bacterium]|tara:strand:- start:398 stop:2995 length:2598 start_codon:yes stop_codon:yes gene_type:complete